MNFTLSYESWAVIAIVLRVFCYAPYILGIFRKKIQPHMVSWFIWFLNRSLVYMVQLYEGAGVGSFPTLFAALTCFLIAISAFFLGKRSMDKKDYISLAVAVNAMLFWLIFRSSLLALAIVMFADMVGYIPTWRKIYKKPNEESPYLFISIAIAGLVSIFAIENMVLETFIQPLYVFVISMGTGLFVLWSRKVSLRSSLVNEAV